MVLLIKDAELTNIFDTIGVTDDEILTANETYGSLGELAIMALPKSKILSLVKRLELGELTREMTVNEDFLATIKDPNIKEIIAKEKTDLFILCLVEILL